MSRESNTRLAYSTGGPPRPTEKRAKPEGTDPRSARRGIRLLLERRASGRLMTVVTGLPGNDAQLSTLARELKSSCGTGGSVRSGTLELQGDQREKVEAALEARGLRSKRAGG